MRIGLTFLIVPLSVGCLSTGATSAQSADSIRDTFRRVSDAVVVVRTQSRELASLHSATATSRYVDIRGLGSGVLVRDDDRIVVVTAAHVIQTAEQVEIELADGRKRRAKVKTSSQMADVALLEVENLPRDARPVKLGDSDKMRVGDRIFVVGAPMGLSHSLTVGYISARRHAQQVLGSMSAMEIFQTDAAINSGNSGGPMFNERGEVVGIVSSILTRSGGFEGIGFAVTSNLARFLLLEEPTLWSGVEGYLLSGELARALNVPQKAGLIVQRVARDSPGSRLGLRAGRLRAQIGTEEILIGGDIVLSVGEITIDGDFKNYEKIRAYLRDLGDDDVLKLKVLREGAVVELTKRRGNLSVR